MSDIVAAADVRSRIKISLGQYKFFHWLPPNHGLWVKQAEQLIMVVSKQYYNVLYVQLLLSNSSHFQAAWRCALTNVPLTEL